VDLHEVRRFVDELDGFVGDVFASLTRKGWQERAGCYVSGLLGPGRRKSVQPMAARLGDDEQSLRHFLADSPWDVVPVRRRLAEKMGPVIDPDGWVIDDTSFPKDGKASPCVANQYCGALGKNANCQVATTVHLASDTASCPVNWRLFVPARWDPASDKAMVDVQARRCAAAIPDDQRHRPSWQLALQAIDEMLAWALPAPKVVTADSAFGDNAEFRFGLRERGLPYAVQIRGDLVMLPEHARRIRNGPGTRLSYRDKPASAAAIIGAVGRRKAVPVTWRTGSRHTPLMSRFVFTRVRPAGESTRKLYKGQDLPACWLIAEWPKGKTEPVKYWLCTLPATTSRQALIRACKLRWRIEHDYRELKTGLGLDHYEGRKWAGWHHHVTLVSAAHAFITLQRLDPNPTAPE
jgi:SRSO17 transposase